MARMIDVDASDYIDRKMNLDISDYMPIKLMQQACSFIDYDKVYFLPLVCNDFSWADVANKFNEFIDRNKQLTHVHSDIMGIDKTFSVNNLPLKILTWYPDHEYQYLLLKGQVLADNLQWLSVTERMIPRVSKEEALVWKALKVLTAFNCENICDFIKPVLDNAPMIEYLEIGYNVGTSQIELDTVGCINYCRFDNNASEMVPPVWVPVIGIPQHLPLVTVSNNKICRLGGGIFNISTGALDELSAWDTQAIIINNPINVNKLHFDSCLPSWNKANYGNMKLFVGVSQISLININVNLLNSFLRHPNFIDFSTVNNVNLYVNNYNEENNQDVLINLIERIVSDGIGLNKKIINILNEQEYNNRYARVWGKYYGFGHDMWSNQ